jgi:hypothetical protein
MKRGLGGLHRKDLMVKIRQARLRKAHLRQALAQGSAQARAGGGGRLREKRVQRLQRALSARKEQLNQALANAGEAEERISKRARGEEEGGGARHGMAGRARGAAGAAHGKGLERAQKAIEARKEDLDRQLRHHQEIEDALRKRLQDSASQVLSLYDPTEISAEQEELEAEETANDSDDTGSDSGGQSSRSASKSSKRSSKKGRKGR